MSCPHIQLAAKLSPPILSQPVHREECTQCFDNQDMPQGIDVCLQCFNGGCVVEEGKETGSKWHHAKVHAEKTGHQLTVNIRRTRKPRPPRDDSEPPLKKLAISEEREEEQYEYSRFIRCYGCGGKILPDASTNPVIAAVVEGISTAMSSARQSEVKAWEEEITACEHTLMLQQPHTSPIPASGLAHCKACELTENLWLCLTCGSLGCGRMQFGGTGGNGHGMQHYEETRHPIAVKLGTITPEGAADIHCYDCNDARIDPELAFHLANFGINVATQTKTQKSLTELQIEQNLRFDFSLTDESGRALEPLFGPGLTGLANLGNSCYLASTVQVLFSLKPFQQRYLSTAELHSLLCPEPRPAECLECQMHKLADGLLSGRYSVPSSHATPLPLSTDLNSISDGDAPTPTPTFQDGLKPTSFKALVGASHPEFSTMRQQDSSEFLTHLLQLLRRDSQKKHHDATNEPPRIFEFGMEQRLHCEGCAGVRYRIDGNEVVGINVPVREKAEKTEEGKPIFEKVSLEECLDALMGEEEIEYRCPRCDRNVKAIRSTRFASFPDVLVIHAKKFQLVNWVPQKLDIPVVVPLDKALVLDKYFGTGRQSGEEELHDDSAGAAAAPTFDADALEQLQGMGFPTIRCQKALLATGNSDADAAMEWLFAHMEDPDIDDPIPTASGGSGPEPSPNQVDMVSEMGFTAAQARRALRETGLDVERAVDWLFNHPDDSSEETASSATALASRELPGSKTLPAGYVLKAFISHKGPSVHSGHYVAHIKEEGRGWVLFNDEKVVKADAESVNNLSELAYVYVFVKENKGL